MLNVTIHVVCGVKRVHFLDICKHCQWGLYHVNRYN